VTVGDLKRALVKTFLDVIQNHTMLMAAGLSYYFVLSLFPALLFLSAALTLLPWHDVFGGSSNIMNYFLPAEAISLIRKVVQDVITPHRSTLLSFGILGSLWAASGGFSAAMEALNVAYDVEENRPIWKTRGLAIALTLITGILLLFSLLVMILGPRFGEWLAARVHLSRLFVLLWPVIHWVLAIGLTVLAVEALYYLAPRVEQRFLATLPGAILAVGCWLGLTYLLGIYFRHFANFDKTYGTLGAAVALMVWLYWTGFAILAGAELNAELAKRSSQGQLQPKQEDPPKTELGSAA
jgi:membrane protein